MRLRYKKLTGSLIGGLALWALVVSPTGAHHGWSWYTGENTSITGIVTSTDFRNPHDRITITVDDAEWDVLFGPPARNRRAGLGPETVKVGDEVTIYGHQHSEPGRQEMKTERIQIGDKVYNVYPERE